MILKDGTDSETVIIRSIREGHPDSLMKLTHFLAGARMFPLIKSIEDVDRLLRTGELGNSLWLHAIANSEDAIQNHFLFEGL